MAVRTFSPLLVRQFAPSRSQRLARTRAVTLATIAALAVGGVVLQEQLSGGRDAVMATAAVEPGPFDYFPG